jgi:hypothetical protein
MVVISLVEERSSVYSMAGRPLGLLFSKLQVKYITQGFLIVSVRFSSVARGGAIGHLHQQRELWEWKFGLIT